MVSPDRDIVVRLNRDAVFAIPFGDPFGADSSTIDMTTKKKLKRCCGMWWIKYTFIDCGANFG